MDNSAFGYIYTSLMLTAKSKTGWTELVENCFSNNLAKSYYESNIATVDAVYTDLYNKQVIIIVKKDGPLFFYNDGEEKVYQPESLKETEGSLFFILIKMIQKDLTICKQAGEINDIKYIIDTHRDDENIVYKMLYEESQEKLEKTQKKLESKTKAFQILQEKYERLLEKNNWDI